MVPGGEVDERIAGGVPEVQRTGRVARRVVDAVYGGVRLLVEMVDSPLLPHLLPLSFRLDRLVLRHSVSGNRRGGIKHSLSSLHAVVKEVAILLTISLSR